MNKDEANAIQRVIARLLDGMIGKRDAGVLLCPDCGGSYTYPVDQPHGHHLGCPQITGDWERSMTLQGDDARAAAVMARWQKK